MVIRITQGVRIFCKLFNDDLVKIVPQWIKTLEKYFVATLIKGKR